ncbi:hypothetical protein D3C81_936910 [compost metagenome]
MFNGLPVRLTASVRLAAEQLRQQLGVVLEQTGEQIAADGVGHKGDFARLADGGLEQVAEHCLFTVRQATNQHVLQWPRRVERRDNAGLAVELNER